jgi:hypothetical protein
MTTIKRTKESFLSWSLNCLSFVLIIVVIVLSVLRPFYCGHGIVCRRTDNAMTTIRRKKDRQYNDQNKKDEGQTMQWPQWKGRRTDNAMTTIKRTKDRQYNDHNKKDEGQKIQWPQWKGLALSVISFLLWSLHCLSFVLFIVVIALSVLRPFHCGHCIVCPSSFLFWSLYCLSFFLLTTMKRTKDTQCNDHNK